MSIKINLIASYVSQIYTTVIGLLILPLLVTRMGPEAYGLVGFFTMLVAWFNLLDVGLTPTVSRETARFRACATSALSYRKLVRALKLAFCTVAVIGAGTMLLCTNLIATSWLEVRTLPLSEVRAAVQLMALTIALRWSAGIYRAVISGFEHLVWLGTCNVIAMTLRFPCVLLVFHFFGASATVFFAFQLFVALAELIALACYADRLMPSLPIGEKVGWSPRNLFVPVAETIGFSISIAFTSMVWIVVTQTDKLILSRVLPLADYGYFTLAVLAASGVNVINGPMTIALLPRLSHLHASGNESEVLQLYRRATQLVAIFALPASLALATYAQELLFAWTGNAVVASRAAPVLRLYALGNGILALASFPYYLQFARGNLRLHRLGSGIYLVLLVPSLVVLANSMGMRGAGYAWLGSNALYFLVWVPLLHHTYMPGLHMHWLVSDVGLVALAALFGTSAWKLSIGDYLASASETRLGAVLCLGAFAAVVMGCATLGSSAAREQIARRLKPRAAANHQ